VDAIHLSKSELCGMYINSDVPIISIILDFAAMFTKDSQHTSAAR